jgi:hypothetical protein
LLFGALYEVILELVLGIKLRSTHRTLIRLFRFVFFSHSYPPFVSVSWVLGAVFYCAISDWIAVSRADHRELTSHGEIYLGSSNGCCLSFLRTVRTDTAKPQAIERGAVHSSNNFNRNINAIVMKFGLDLTSQTKADHVFCFNSHLTQGVYDFRKQ